MLAAAAAAAFVLSHFPPGTAGRSRDLHFIAPAILVAAVVGGIGPDLAALVLTLLAVFTACQLMAPEIGLLADRILP